ncbi:MAG: hypothetical protein R3F12_15240 [Lysobacteraceae bacterium]
MLSIYNGFPGLFSQSGDDGAWELSTYLLNVPGWQLMAAVVFLGFAAVFLIGLVRQWLDPNSRGVEVLRWSLSSPAITTMLALVPFGLLIVLLLVPGSAIDTAGTILMLCSILLYWALPFWAWNREMLAGPVPSVRWRPRWPGWAALGALLAWAIVPVFGESAALFATATGAGLIGGLLLISTFLAELLMPVWTAMFWLNPQQPRAAIRDLRWALAWPNLGSWLWVWLAQLLIAAALLLPILLATGLYIYVAPQMVAFEQSMMTPEETTFGANEVARVLGVMSEWGMYAVFPSLAVLQLLVLGRLLDQRKREQAHAVLPIHSERSDREFG